MKNKVFIIAVIIIFLGLSISCKPELKFGDLIICGEINEETFEPIDPGESFSAEQKRIYATISYNGAKGNDEYRFKWINTTTGETALDKSSHYNANNNSYFEGYVASSIYTTGEIKIIPPGNYEVEFFHNDEIKSRKSFIVTKPELKIIDIVLTDEIDDYAAPVGSTLEFGPNDTVYACIKTNYLISGNTITAKWYSPNGELMLETPIELEEDYYEENYIAFDFSGIDSSLTPGKYKVEVFLNGKLHDSYVFNISESGAENLFSQGNTYINDKFNFSVSIPDNWSYKQKEDSESIQISLKTEEEVPLGFSIIANSGSDNPEEEDYPVFSETVLKDLTDSSSWERIEKAYNIFKTSQNIKFHEFIYTYHDINQNEWIIITSFTEKNNITYIFFAMSRFDYYQIADRAYQGIIKSFSN